MTLQDLPALKRVATLQLLPPIHRAHLDTNHILIPILRLEIAHALCLLGPGIPDDAIDEVVTLDIEPRLTVLDYGGGVLLNGFVDAIAFAADLEFGCGLLMFAGVEDFIDVGCASEAIDGAACDVLYDTVSHAHTQVR